MRGGGLTRFGPFWMIVHKVFFIKSWFVQNLNQISNFFSGMIKFIQVLRGGASPFGKFYMILLLHFHEKFVFGHQGLCFTLAGL